MQKSVKTFGIINYNNALSGTADTLWPVGADDRTPTRNPTFKPTNHMTIVQWQLHKLKIAPKVGIGESPVVTQRASGAEQARRKVHPSPVTITIHKNG